MQRHRAEAAVRALPDVAAGAPVRVLIGPLNTAGQAHQWSRAAASLAGVSAVSLTATLRSSAPSLGYPSDVRLDQAMQLHGLSAHRSRVLGLDASPGMTHILAESGRPVLGAFHAGSVRDDLPALDAAGIRTALVIHGSEMRDLRRHAELYPHSPFRGEWDERWHRMQGHVERTRALVEGFSGPVVVSTPDLLDFVPGATLLPVVVDVNSLADAASRVLPALQRRRPVVLHAPSNPRLKGTRTVEKVLTDLDAQGVVTFRRLSGTPHHQMAAALAQADIVVDQIVLGNPGVLLAEAMAAGRVVVAHLSPDVRSRLAGHDPGGEEAPVVGADPDTLKEAIQQILAERTTYQQLATRGPNWARRNHDGTQAGHALSRLLGISPPP